MIQDCALGILHGTLHLMRTPALLLTGFAALIATTATAGPETDFPHRDWGKIATLDMNQADASACVARAMDREGSVLVLPVDGGNDIDFSPGGLFGATTGEPFLRFKVRGGGSTSSLRVFYRHPIKQKLAGRYVEKLQKRCLKVRQIDPT